MIKNNENVFILIFLIHIFYLSSRVSFIWYYLLFNIVLFFVVANWQSSIIWIVLYLNQFFEWMITKLVSYEKIN